jgi:divalent metal cation (Fe/Co/Zn/Cd) transporter
MEDTIVAAIRHAPRVRRIIHLRTEHLGPDEVLLAAKVEFDHDLTITELADAIDAAEALVRAQVPEARVIYIEPDIFRG